MRWAPAFTASPDLTNIFVTTPSTCGLIVVELRDFNVPTYSVLSFTGSDFAVTMPTGIGGIVPPPAGAAACLLPPQPAIANVMIKDAARCVFVIYLFGAGNLNHDWTSGIPLSVQKFYRN